MGKIVEIEGVNKIYGTNHVVKDLNLSIEEGEFLTLLGSSGCGKTTTLRMIAGFEEPTTGTIMVEGERVEDKEPFERNVNTVFQSYALFPHKTIYDNIAYGLKMKKVPKAEIKKRVCEMMEMVQLSGFEKRYPAQMSGGQKQRISLARALLKDPSILILDDTTSAVDMETESYIQNQLKKIEKDCTIFIIAYRISSIKDADLILVMDQGRIVEQGTHEELVRAGGYYATAFHHQYGDYAQQSAQSEGKEA